MVITLHCGGMPFNGNTINEASLGGSETAAYYLAKELAAIGHDVTLFTNISEKDQGVFDGVNYASLGQSSEKHPLGNRFEYYAQNTPIDILIIQRHPNAFTKKWQSKVNLWWTHDLPLGRMKDMVHAQMWNIDAILCVSEFHKKRMMDVYGLKEDCIHVLKNAIDVSLFEKAEKTAEKFFPDFKKLLYVSRPERGLENLVKPGGIMERLAKEDPSAKLFVCGYDNVTPHMKDYYEYLYGRIAELPNCENLGYLKKEDLYSVMLGCDALFYPSAFEETSCISAMEAMAAGLKIIGSNVGALPETCSDLAEADKQLIFLSQGEVNERAFIEAAKDLNKDKSRLEHRRNIARSFDWKDRAQQVESIYKYIASIYSKESKLKSDIYFSDVEKLLEKRNEYDKNAIEKSVKKEIEDCYKFSIEDDFYTHYQKYSNKEISEKLSFDISDLSKNNRFASVEIEVSRLSGDAVVVDYGCGHGNYTINLAKRHPGKTFVGIDIGAHNIQCAIENAKKHNVENAYFINGHMDGGDLVYTGAGRVIDDLVDTVDAVIVAEVLEHVKKPEDLLEGISNFINSVFKPDKFKFILTTPYGPWESISYDREHPLREHLWHFTKDQIKKLSKNGKNQRCIVAPFSHDKHGSAIGSYVWSFDADETFSCDPIEHNIESEIPARQTVSVCMIARDAEATILKTLKSVSCVADEIIIRIDEESKDGTELVIAGFDSAMHGLKPVTVFKGKSPAEIGFDAARNETIEKACGDWILWIDSDETLVHPESLHKYLRNNAVDAYAINHVHFSADPPEVLKVDIPTRLFRNGKGVKFFGLVHEHPELALNKGIGNVSVLPDVSVAHNGYITEAVRRERFARNIGLMQRDRKEYPERLLGKFLWVRDIAQMSQYERESNNGQISNEMIALCEQGLKLWEELLDKKQTRMIVSGISFYDVICKVLGYKFEMSFAIDAEPCEGADIRRVQPVKACFHSKEAAMKLINQITDERLSPFSVENF